LNKATNKEQNIRIQASGGLSDADIEQMVKDAEANAETDKKRRALVEVKNQAESLIHQTEKTIKDLGDDVNSADKAEAESAIATLKTTLEGENKDDIEQKMSSLQQIAMKVGEAAYRKAQENSAGAPDSAAPSENTSTSSTKNDDVIDADFTFDDDDKKSA
jgi:molecular chaperone DnaK